MDVDLLEGGAARIPHAEVEGRPGGHCGAIFVEDGPVAQYIKHADLMRIVDTSEILRDLDDGVGVVVGNGVVKHRVVPMYVARRRGVAVDLPHWQHRTGGWLLTD